MNPGPAVALALGALLGTTEPPSPPAADPAVAPAAKAPSEKPSTEKTKAKPSTKRPALPAASLPVLDGDVAAIDHRTHQVRVRTSSGEVTLSFDRDTFVRDPMGAATPLQITPGAKVRIGRDGDARAAWVEVSAAPSTPRPSP